MKPLLLNNDNNDEEGEDDKEDDDGASDDHKEQQQRRRGRQTQLARKKAMLEFRKKSLQRERNYVRSLRELIAARKEAKADPSRCDEDDSVALLSTSTAAASTNTTTNSATAMTMTTTWYQTIVRNAQRILCDLHRASLSSAASIYHTNPNAIANTHKHTHKHTQTHTHKHENIHDMDYVEMYYHLQCHVPSTRTDKPLPTPRSRRLLWEAFRNHSLFPEFPFPPSLSLDEDDEDEEKEEEFTESSSSSPPPLYRINHHPDKTKGRGAFAARFLPEGTLVHGAHPGTVFFLHASDFYRFVAALPTRDVACDVLDWVWMQDLVGVLAVDDDDDDEDDEDYHDDYYHHHHHHVDYYHHHHEDGGVEENVKKPRKRLRRRRSWESGSKVLCLNLDDGAFINHGSGDESNIGLGYGNDYEDEEYEYGDDDYVSNNKHSLEFYALRDIEEGEELLYDYDSTPWSLEEMDLNV
ncbi:hypothetical protein ACHAXS_004735 [Conticribra weissflogii]